MLVTGCQITSDKYIDMKTEENKQDFTKFMLKQSLSELVETIDTADDSDILLDDNKELEKLAVWLGDNDCLEEDIDFLSCYVKTRTMLIEVAYQYDKLSTRNYEANRNVCMLKENLSTVIKSLN